MVAILVFKEKTNIKAKTSKTRIIIEDNYIQYILPATRIKEFSLHQHTDPNYCLQ